MRLVLAMAGLTSWHSAAVPKVITFWHDKGFSILKHLPPKLLSDWEVVSKAPRPRSGGVEMSITAPLCTESRGHNCDQYACSLTFLKPKARLFGVRI